MILRIGLCITFFCFGSSLVVGWWLAKRERVRFIQVGSERHHSSDWLLFLGVALMSGSVWWGLA